VTNEISACSDNIGRLSHFGSPAADPVLHDPTVLLHRGDSRRKFRLGIPGIPGNAGGEHQPFGRDPAGDFFTRVATRSVTPSELRASSFLGSGESPLSSLDHSFCGLGRRPADRGGTTLRTRVLVAALMAFRSLADSNGAHWAVWWVARHRTPSRASCSGSTGRARGGGTSCRQPVGTSSWPGHDSSRAMERQARKPGILDPQFPSRGRLATRST